MVDILSNETELSLQFLVSQSAKGMLLFLIINQHVNGCYTFCLFCVNDLNQKLPGLTFINKLLIVISMLFALNVTYRVLISGLHGVLTQYWGVVVFGGFFCGIAVFGEFFCGIAVFRTPQCPPHWWKHCSKEVNTFLYFIIFGQRYVMMYPSFKVSF